MKTAFLLFASIVLCHLARAESPGSVPDPRKTNRSSIYDGAHVLSDAQKHRIDDAINALEKKTKAQMMVVTVRTLDGMTIEEWCTKLYRRIGIGHKGKNDGVLFAFAIRDRKSRIEVGPGLHGRLTDARTGEIQRNQIRPAFRRGAYGDGILEGVQVAANYVRGGGRAVPRATSKASARSMPANHSSSSGNSSPSSGFPASSTTYSPPSSSGGGAGELVLLLGVLAVGGVGGLVYVTTRPRRCPQCNTSMTESEAPDSELSDAEQVERQLGSRTFRRWGCPQCGYSELDKNAVTFSNYTRCSGCGNRTAQVRTDTISSATYDSEGEEEVTEMCQYPPCRHINRRRRSISRLVHASASTSSSFGSSSSDFGGSSSDNNSSSSSSDSSSSSSGGSYDGGSSSSYGGGTSDGGGSSSSW